MPSEFLLNIITLKMFSKKSPRNNNFHSNIKMTLKFFSKKLPRNYKEIEKRDLGYAVRFSLQHYNNFEKVLLPAEHNQDSIEECEQTNHPSCWNSNFQE